MEDQNFYTLHRRKPQSSEATLQDRLQTIYKHEFKKRLENLEDDDEIFKARRKIALELKDTGKWIRELLEKSYKDELKVKKRRAIPQWREAPTIKATLDKTRFEDVWGYIWQQTIPLSDTVKICEKKNICDHIRIVKGKERKCRYVLFQPIYNEMEEALKLGKQSLHKYIKRMVEMGILKQLVLHGNISGIYAVGYYSQFRDKDTKETGDKRNPFLKNSKEMREKLKKFKL